VLLPFSRLNITVTAKFLSPRSQVIKCIRRGTTAESEERRKTGWKKASHSESAPYPFRIKSAPGRKSNPQPSATLMLVSSRSRVPFPPGADFILNRWGLFSERLAFFCPSLTSLRFGDDKTSTGTGHSSRSIKPFLSCSL
jgi:hypothetical protein